MAIRVEYNSKVKPVTGMTGGLDVNLQHIYIMFVYIREFNFDYAFPTKGEYGDFSSLSMNIKFGSD